MGRRRTTAFVLNEEEEDTTNEPTEGNPFGLEKLFGNNIKGRENLMGKIGLLKTKYNKPSTGARSAE